MRLFLILLLLLGTNLILLLAYFVVVKGGFLKKHLNRVMIDESRMICDSFGSQVEVRSGVFHAKLATWTLPSAIFDAIPDEVTALRVASAVMDGKSPEKNYSPVQVAYDKKDRIWIVSFKEDTDTTESENVENLAIRKKDGKILSTLIGWQSSNAN